MTHAEARDQRDRVAAYRKSHPFASDKEIGTVLGMKWRRVAACRLAAGLPAGSLYVSSSEVLDTVREMGTTDAMAVAKHLGMGWDAAGTALRTLRQRGLLVSTPTRPVRWSVAT